MQLINNMHTGWFNTLWHYGDVLSSTLCTIYLKSLALRIKESNLYG